MKKLLLLTLLINLTITKGQIVNIPDANFKSALISANSSNQFIATNAHHQWIVIDVNQDGEIQYSEAQDVYELDVSNMNISDLTGIEAFTNLTRLVCADNQLSNLDISNNVNLQRLICYSNNLTDLDVSNNTNLIQLYCSENQLNNLDVSNNINLKSLNFSFTQITNIDISNNINLEYLTCTFNQMTNLNVLNNINLIQINCGYNQLSDMDVSNNTNLRRLLCKSNLFNNLDISNNPALTSLTCSHNPNLTYINLKNGNNENFNLTSNCFASFLDLPNLQNVCVDELNTDLTDYILNQVGHSINFSTDCSALNLDENKILDFTIYPIPTENTLNIETDKTISTIEIYNKLGQMVKTDTKNTIDISNLIKGIYFVKIYDIYGNIGIKKIFKK